MKPLFGWLILALTSFLFANLDQISDKQLRIITILGWTITVLFLQQ